MFGTIYESIILEELKLQKFKKLIPKTGNVPLSKI